MIWLMLSPYVTTQLDHNVLRKTLTFVNPSNTYFFFFYFFSNSSPATIAPPFKYTNWISQLNLQTVNGSSELDSHAVPWDRGLRADWLSDPHLTWSDDHLLALTSLHPYVTSSATTIDNNYIVWLCRACSIVNHYHYHLFWRITGNWVGDKSGELGKRVCYKVDWPLKHRWTIK